MKYNDLIDILKEHFKVEISKRSLSLFNVQCKRLGRDNEEDFLFSVILDCLETQKKESALDDLEVYRAIDRVAHRFYRQISNTRDRFEDNTYIDSVYTQKKSSGEYAEKLIQIIDALSKLTPLHLSLFYEKVLNGRSIKDISQQEGVSERTMYRLLKDIQESVRGIYSKDT